MGLLGVFIGKGDQIKPKTTYYIFGETHIIIYSHTVWVVSKWKLLSFWYFLQFYKGELYFASVEPLSYPLLYVRFRSIFPKYGGSMKSDKWLFLYKKDLHGLMDTNHCWK